MIVMYARDRGFKGKGNDPHFTLGQLYIVLSFRITPDGFSNFFCIRSSSDGTPVLLESEYFDVVEPDVPTGWGLFDNKDGYYTLEPIEFSNKFWDDYNEGCQLASDLFEKVYSRLQQEKTRNGMKPA